MNLPHYDRARFGTTGIAIQKVALIRTGTTGRGQAGGIRAVKNVLERLKK